MIENFFIDSYLRETKPDCLLYAEDGSKLKIHKVRVLYFYFIKKVKCFIEYVYSQSLDS